MTVINANGLRHYATPSGTGFRLACCGSLVFRDDRESRPCIVCFPGEWRARRAELNVKDAPDKEN